MYKKFYYVCKRRYEEWRKTRKCPSEILGVKMVVRQVPVDLKWSYVEF